MPADYDQQPSQTSKMAAYYTFEDYSGTSTPNTSDNPYDGLIENCKNDPHQIQATYNNHRTNRNAQQKSKLLSPDFPGVTIDEILANLEDPTQPDYKDWRNCLVFWARPTAKVRTMIAEVQAKLLEVAPSLWTMPPTSLHMTALEITHSLTAPEIEAIVAQMQPILSPMANHTKTHRARLVKPVISFDAQALALSFLPAAGEPGRSLDEDRYSYHHLRRDLFAQAHAGGVKVGSRYVVPSAHLTIARFIKPQDFEMEVLMRVVGELNVWLEREFWPTEEGEIKDGGEWVVGEEKGLEVRKGVLWYGSGGETVLVGEGF